MPNSFLQELILIVTAAFVGGFLARLILLPPILGYIVSGVLFGTVSSSIFPSQSLLLKLSELGVSLLLFTLGFEVSIDKLRSINKKIIIIGFLHVVVIGIILLPLLIVLKLSVPVAILLSLLFSFSSTAIVGKILEEKGLMSEFPGNVIFVFLLIQDLFVIPIIYFLPLLFSQLGVTFSDIISFAFSIIKTTVIFSVLFVTTKFLLPRLMNVLFRYPSHEFNLLATIFIATSSITILTGIGIPQAIAAFLSGILISEEGKNLAPLSEIRPLRDILLVLFFVSTGMLLDINYLINNIGLVAILALGITFIKFFVIYLLLRLSGFIPSSSVFISVYLANIGEFAAVIGQIAYTRNILIKSEYNLLLSVFIFSLLLVPFWTYLLRPRLQALGNLRILKRMFGSQFDLTLYESVRGLSDHVIICGHGRVGKQIRGLLELANISYIVIDYNQKVINDLIKINKFAMLADPTEWEVLEHANVRSAKAVVIAIPDRTSQKKIIQEVLKKNPKILILARSHEESDRSDLINLGVNSVTFPEFEAGVKIGRELLEVFGVDRLTVHEYVKKIRRDHNTP